MVHMKRALFAAIMFAGFTIAADTPVVAHPQLQQIHNVYLLPMASALDQYLANRLTSTGLFQVVTDPKKADAVFSDKIGQGLEQKLDELYPPPDLKKTDDEAKDPYAKPAARFASFSRGRGTVFIVDRKTRAVVWSIYAPMKDSRPDGADKRAASIVKKLQQDRGVK